MGATPTLGLNTGAAMPQLGFGVFQVPPETTAAVVSEAIRCGYRSIDTARAYGNEAGVGEAIRSAGVERDELFVTTKLWNSHHGAERAGRAFDRSLRDLGLDYVDLYLIHWPLPRQDRYVETWGVLEEIHADGRARAIGVSNFEPAHLERLIDECETVPAVNQVELHPRFQQTALREVHERHGIVTEAWSPLAKAGDILEDPVVVEIAETQSRTPAQVILRWHVQTGNVAIPKSETPERIAENIAIFDFELSAEEMGRIDALDTGRRSGPDPEEFELGAEEGQR